jgi:hypothetical protein
MRLKSWPSVPRILRIYLTWLSIVVGAFTVIIFLVAYPIFLLCVGIGLAVVAAGAFFAVVDLSRARRLIAGIVVHLMRQLLHQHG